MSTGEILTWFFLVTGALIIAVSYWVGAYALFPDVVEGCRARYGARVIAATGLGLALLFVLLVVIVVAQRAVPNSAVRNALGVVLAAPAALLALLGSAGLALRVGAGLPTPRDATESWRRAVRGGAVLGLMCLLPFLGWFVLLPFTLVSGLGAAVMALWSGDVRAPASQGAETSAR